MAASLLDFYHKLLYTGSLCTYLNDIFLIISLCQAIESGLIDVWKQWTYTEMKEEYLRQAKNEDKILFLSSCFIAHVFSMIQALLPWWWLLR